MRNRPRQRHLFRISWTLITGLVLSLGICLPNLGHAGPKANTEVCAGLLKLSVPSEDILDTKFDPQSKMYVTTRWSKQEFITEEMITTVHRTYQVTSSRKPKVDVRAHARYLENVSPLIELANQYFESRRGWGQQNTEQVGANPFSKKNLQVAQDYLSRSSYVIVHDRNGRLLGGMRNIAIRESGVNALPEERFLRISVPQMGLARTVPNISPWKNEAGTFVIQEDLTPEMHQKLRLQIWTHLYQFIFSKDSVRENFYDQAVHTYGDRKSVLMYKASGFQKLRIYFHEGKWVDYTHLADKDIPPIIVDNEPWWPLVLLPEDALALNEKFSTGTRAHVDPTWLLNRRQEMSDPEISTYQMGALFPNLIVDLESKDRRRFAAALTGLATIIESASEHMDVAKTAFYDRAISDRAVDHIINIREQLFQLVMTLSLKLRTWDAEQRHQTMLFAGHILNLKDKAANYMFTSEFLEKVVFRSLADPELGNGEIMMRYLKMARTPKEWLEQTGVVWDLEQSGENQFARDTAIANETLVARLKLAGISVHDIDEAASRLREALFQPVRILGDPNGVYSYDYRSSRLASWTLLAFANRDPEKISLLIKLAAARQYLLDRKAKN